MQIIEVIYHMRSGSSIKDLLEQDSIVKSSIFSLIKEEYTYNKRKLNHSYIQGRVLVSRKTQQIAKYKEGFEFELDSNN